MVPYYSPNITVRKIFKSLFSKDKSIETSEYFKKITGKKYVLLTNSARAALYLSYKAISINNGSIITSPLTCRSALDPIVQSGNNPIFIDINKDTLNFDENRLFDLALPENTKAIQVIHHGGFVCNMDVILDYAKKKNLIVIEDCAQSFSSTYKNQQAGSFGEIACFSLIKNAYGIGGGILATNDEKVYLTAKNLQDNLPILSLKKMIIRVIRALFESYRINKFVEFLYLRLMNSMKKSKEIDTFNKELKKPRKFIFKVFFSQINELELLHKKRLNNAVKLLSKLKKNNLIYNYKSINNINNSSFTKLFVYNPVFNSKRDIELLNNMGIEAMHLEHSYKNYYQERFDNDAKYKNYFKIDECVNYLEIQNKIISLPLFENDMNIDFIIKSLKQLVNE